MRVSRERFIDHFAISIRIHALRGWPRRGKEPPDHLGRRLYDVICVTSGEIPIDAGAFGQIVKPVIHELHRLTPRGQRPDASDLTGRVYDALSAAGVEVTIRPPVRAHGQAIWARRT